MFLTKVLLLGYAGASYIEENFIDISFSKKYLYTIGADFSVKVINFNERDFKFQIWRIADSDRFRNLRTIFYLGSHAVILCFDVTRPSTIDNLFLNWLPELEKNLKDIRIPYILVGINTHKREVSNPFHVTKEQGFNYAKRISKIYSEGQLPVYYFELSPLLQSSNLIFYTLARFILSLKNYGHIIFDNDLVRFQNKSVKEFINEVINANESVISELSTLNDFSFEQFDQVTISELKKKIKLINKLDMEIASLEYAVDEYILKNKRKDFKLEKLNTSIKQTNKLKNKVLDRLYSSLSLKNFVLEVSLVKTNINHWLGELNLLMVKKRQVENIKDFNKLKENFDRVLAHTHTIKLIKKPNLNISNIPEINLGELYESTLFAINNFKKMVYDEYHKMSDLEQILEPITDKLEIITSLDSYKVICFTDRAEIDGKNILLAYHCPVCKIFLCSYCYNSLMEEGEYPVLCPGTMISSEHIIETIK